MILYYILYAIYYILYIIYSILYNYSMLYTRRISHQERDLEDLRQHMEGQTRVAGLVCYTYHTGV